jgi:hypothetical protein
MKKYSLFALLLVLAFQVSAQETEKYRKDESIASQVLNNRVPGLQYAPESKAVPQVQPHATMVEEIKAGKYGKVKTGGASAPSPSVTARSANVQLASEKSSVAGSGNSGKASQAPAVTLPSQGDVSEGAGSAKPSVIKETKSLPVKKD